MYIRENFYGKLEQIREEQLDELKASTARRAEHKAAGRYYNDYDDETAARRKAINSKSPETLKGAEAAKAKREKSAKRVIRFQNYADKKEKLNEVSKSTLGSYIKKASHDVATKSAATGRYADRANKARDKMKKGDYSDWQQGKKDDEFADKMFKKSWKRRQGIAKATDRLIKEDQLDEVSIKTAVKAYRARKDRADDFYGEKNDGKKAAKTLARIEKKHGSKIAGDASKPEKKYYDTSQDYLSAKEGVYSKFSRSNSKKGTKQRKDYMTLNKGRFSK
jgi:hypothetical protein